MTGIAALGAAQSSASAEGNISGGEHRGSQLEIIKRRENRRSRTNS